MKSSILFLLLAAIGISGCTCLPSRSGAKIATVDEVLNSVKDELNAYAAMKSKVTPNYGVCHTKGSEPIKFVPTKITLKLKTVATNTNEPNIGVIAPFGVVSFDPSYSGAYSRSRTQTLEVPLNVQSMEEPQTVTEGPHPLAEAIANYRDAILKVNHDKTPCLEYKKENNLKMSLVFDVVNKSTGGFSLKLAIFKIGDKQTNIDEAHQTLDLEFSMGNGTVIMNKSPEE